MLCVHISPVQTNVYLFRMYTNSLNVRAARLLQASNKLVQFAIVYKSVYFDANVYISLLLPTDA